MSREKRAHMSGAMVVLALIELLLPVAVVVVVAVLALTVGGAR